MSSRLSWATWEDPVSKKKKKHYRNQKKKKNKTKKKPKNENRCLAIVRLNHNSISYLIQIKYNIVDRC
jgi:hypothetical protein